MPIQVLIADDHDVVRAGLQKLLSAAGDLKVAAEAADGAAALAAVRKQAPDVVLLDVRMPGLDGLACLATLRSEFPDLPVVMFSAYDNPTYKARSVALGAVGYVDKAAGGAEIVDAVRTAARGKSLWTSETLRKLSGAMAAPRLPAETESALTRREVEVLAQLAHGLSNKEIAQALSISYETVKEHVQHILRKIGVADRTQAAVWAVRQGLA